MKKVLSLSGGGYRGLIEAYILNYLEHKMQEPIYNKFDIIAGTSTGSILAGGLSVGKSAEELLQFYLELGPKVFAKPTISYRVRSVFGLHKSKFDREIFYSYVEKNLGGGNIDETFVPVLMTVFNITTGTPCEFNSFKDSNVKLVDAILASSAAPTYFTPTIINNEEYIDGGVYAPDPSRVVMDYIKDVMDIGPDNSYLLSLGTGSKLVGYENVTKWWKYEWITPLVQLMMSADTTSTDKEMKSLFKHYPSSYTRINEPLNKSYNKDMADASKENTNLLKAHAVATILRNKKKLDEVADILKSL